MVDINVRFKSAEELNTFFQSIRETVRNSADSLTNIPITFLSTCILYLWMIFMILTASFIIASLYLGAGVFASLQDMNYFWAIYREKS